MRGDPQVIEYLNKGLRSELTSINQYWLHYRLLDNWGYKALAKKWRQESMEEMQHADKFTVRIIFLDGMPNMQVLKRHNLTPRVRNGRLREFYPALKTGWLGNDSDIDEAALPQKAEKW